MIAMIVLGILRHVLTSLGGALLWHGLETATHSHTAFGAVLTVAGMALSVKQKVQSGLIVESGPDYSKLNK